MDALAVLRVIAHVAVAPIIFMPVVSPFFAAALCLSGVMLVVAKLGRDRVRHQGNAVTLPFANAPIQLTATLLLLPVTVCCVLVAGAYAVLFTASVALIE